MTNDRGDLPIRSDGGSRVLAFDFPAFRVGIAEYPDGPTGTTVLHFPDGATAALDVRGGSPGVIGDYGFVHAIALAGGSLLGLEAASGVAAGLLARGGYRARFSDIPLVSGGIVFDFGRRDNSIYPDKRLGRAALDAAVPGGFRSARAARAAPSRWATESATTAGSHPARARPSVSSAASRCSPA